MKTKLVLLLLLMGAIALFLGIDTLYNNTVAQQVEPVAAAPIVQAKIQNTLIGRTPTVVKGFDWSLPQHTRITPNSGMVGNEDNSMRNHEFIPVLWSKTNPRKGVYNFSKLQKKLSSLGAKKALIRLEVNSSCEAPAWAMKQLRASKDKSLIFWDQNYINLLQPYLNAFAKRFANSPQVAGVHLGIGDGEFSGSCDNYDNKDGWGEFWMSPEVLAEAEKSFGFTPDIFEARSKQIIDIYAKAFGANKSKLAFTNQGPLFSWDDGADAYNKKLTKIAFYALGKGLGSRDGGTEPWLRFTDRIYGSDLNSMPDGTCRLDFDENYAKKIKGRYWGTENEFYGNKSFVTEQYGPYKNQPYRFMVSSLRALQMRRNYITIAGDSMKKIKHPDYKTQDFMRYLSKVMGKQIDNTPDAFVLLGERYLSAFRAVDHKNEPCVKANGNKVPVRSFGRWLTDNTESTAAIKIRMPASENYWGQNYYMPEGLDYEYAARKSKRFAFDLNNELANKRCAKGCEVEVKFTFKDTLKTGLTIQVAEGHTKTLQTSGDQHIKTATFKLKSRFSQGGLDSNGSDFILQSQQAIPVFLMRVNFLSVVSH